MVQQNTWQWALDGFKYELELQVKPKTVDYYHSRVKIFAKWASETRGISSPTLVSKRDIQAFLHGLTPYDPPTNRGRDINSYRWPYYRALKRYSSWIIHEGIQETNPMDGISLRAPRAPIIEPYRPEHIQKIIIVLELEQKQAHTPREKMRAARNIAIVSLFLESGARLSELVNLTINDVDLDSKSIMIRNGKMGKGRKAGFGPRTKKALWRYMGQRGKEIDHDALWVSEEYSPLTTNGVQTIFRRLKQSAGLGSIKGSIHKLRHTFATAFLRHTKDMKGCRILLGHSTMAMTEKYTQFIDAEDALHSYNGQGPLDWLK